MGKCKFCDVNRASVATGVCNSCYDFVKDDIVKQKTILNELASQARPDLSEEEKHNIIFKANEAYETLKEYKALELRHFKSDISEPRNQVYKNLGLLVPDNDNFSATKCSVCGGNDVVVNSYNEKQNAGCGAYLFWTLFIVLSIITFFAFSIIGLIVMIPILAIALYVWSLRKRNHKVRNLCICKSCGHKWYI